MQENCAVVRTHGLTLTWPDVFNIFITLDPINYLQAISKLPSLEYKSLFVRQWQEWGLLIEVLQGHREELWTAMFTQEHNCNLALILFKLYCPPTTQRYWALHGIRCIKKPIPSCAPTQSTHVVPPGYFYLFCVSLSYLYATFYLPHPVQ